MNRKNDSILQQFHADGEAAYQETLRTNAVYRGDAIKAYVLARLAGSKPSRPKAVPLDPTRPLQSRLN